MSDITDDVFRTGGCCVHEWRVCGQPFEYCRTCGATCVRDESRKIVEYDATARYARPKDNGHSGRQYRNSRR
jgi:hypothetical protein